VGDGVLQGPVVEVLVGVPECDPEIGEALPAVDGGQVIEPGDDAGRRAGEIGGEASGGEEVEGEGHAVGGRGRSVRFGGRWSGNAGSGRRMHRSGRGIRLDGEDDRHPVVVKAGLVQVEVGSDPGHGVVEYRDEQNVPVVQRKVPAARRSPDGNCDAVCDRCHQCMTLVAGTRIHRLIPLSRSAAGPPRAPQRAVGGVARGRLRTEAVQDATAHPLTGGYSRPGRAW
jgi:hypothetical protein